MHTHSPHPAIALKLGGGETAPRSRDRISGGEEGADAIASMSFSVCMIVHVLEEGALYRTDLVYCTCMSMECGSTEVVGVPPLALCVLWPISMRNFFACGAADARTFVLAGHRRGR